MLNLKPSYDAAQAANAEVLRVANEINAAFELGTEEGKQQAMALHSVLNDAQAKAAAALDLYESMKKAASTGDAAAKFVPVNDAEQPDPGKKVITRKDYEALDYQARYEFFKAGGSIVDTLEE